MRPGHRGGKGGVKERRSSRVVALGQATLGGLGHRWPEAATILVVTLTATGLAVLAPAAAASIPAPAGLSAAGWHPAVTVGLDLLAALTVLTAAGGIGTCLVRAQRSRLDLLATLGLTPRQCALVVGLQLIVAGVAGAALGAAGGALATPEVGPASLPSLLGAALCLAAGVVGAGLASRDAAPPDPHPARGRRPARRSSLLIWGLPVAVALGMAAQRDPSLRGLRRLLPVLLGLDLLARELAAGGRSAAPTWGGWERAALAPGRPGLVANLLLALVVAGYFCTLLLLTGRQGDRLGVLTALGATRAQLLTALVIPAVRSPLAGLALAALAAAALHLAPTRLVPTSAGDLATALVPLARPAALLPAAAALVAGLAGVALAAWRVLPTLRTRRLGAG